MCDVKDALHHLLHVIRAFHGVKLLEIADWLAEEFLKRAPAYGLVFICV